MDEKTFAALKMIMSSIGSIEDGQVYLYDPHATKPAMFRAFGKVSAWMDEVAIEIQDLETLRTDDRSPLRPIA